MDKINALINKYGVAPHSPASINANLPVIDYDKNRKEEEERRKREEAAKRELERRNTKLRAIEELAHSEPNPTPKSIPIPQGRGSNRDKAATPTYKQLATEKKEKVLAPYKQFSGELRQDITNSVEEKRALGMKEEEIKKSLIPEEDPKVRERLEQIASKIKEGKEGTLYNMYEGALEREVMNSLSKEYVRKMNGLPNNVKMIEEFIAENPELMASGDQGFWDKSLRGAADLYRQGFESAKASAVNPATYVAIGTLAVASLALGAVTGGLGTLATMPLLGTAIGSLSGGAMIGFGMKYGSYEHMAELEAGQSYQELLEAGIRPDIAKTTATTVGAVNGLIEMVQIDRALSMIPGFDDLLENGAKQALNTGAKEITRVLASYGKDLASNVVEEMLQEGVSIAGLEFTKALKDSPDPSNIDGLIAVGKLLSKEEHRERILDTGLSALQTMWLAPIISSSGQVALNKSFQATQDKMQMKQIEKVSDVEAKHNKARVEQAKDVWMRTDKDNIVDVVTQKLNETLDPEYISMLNSGREVLNEIKGRTDTTNQEVEGINKQIDKIDKVLDKFIYDTKEKNPDIEYKTTDKGEIAANVLADDYLDNNIPLVPMTKADINYYKQAAKHNLVNEIKDGLKNGTSKAEILNEITKKLPKKEQRPSIVMAMINSVELVNYEIDGVATANSMENITEANKYIEDVTVEDVVNQEAKEEVNVETNPEVNVESELATEPLDDGEVVSDTVASLEEETTPTEPIESLEIDTEPTEEVTTNLPIMVDVDKIHVDPERFQFRYDKGNAKGATRALEGAEWNPLLAKSIDVWQDEYGDMYVVNGHHRLDLANQNGVTEIQATVISHKEFTEDQARTHGAMINIAENNATAVDVAKLLRDSSLTVEEMESFGVSPRSKIAKDGFALSQLNDHIFTKVAIKAMPLERAVIIGRSLAGNEAGQNQMMATLNKMESRGKNITNGVLTEVIAQVKGMAQDKFVEISLLGEQEITKNLFVERAELVDYVKGQLKDRVSLLKNVSKEKNATVLESLGNTIKVDSNVQDMTDAEQALWILDKTVNYAGTKANELFNNLAKELANADPKDQMKIKKKALNEIIKLMEGGELLNETINQRTKRQSIKESIRKASTDGESRGESGPSIQTTTGQQEEIAGQATLMQLKELPRLEVNVENKQTTSYKAVAKIISALKKNVFFNGLTIEVKETQKKVTLTRGELDGQGYGHFQEGKEYNVYGEYDNGTRTISLYEGSTRDTILEEAIHDIQNRLGEINPKLKALVDVWEADIKAQAKELGIDIPQKFELLAKALVYSELGYASSDTEMANLIAVDEDIVDGFKAILGQDLLDVAMGLVEADTTKEERTIRAEYEGYAERIFKDETYRYMDNVLEMEKQRKNEIITELENARAVSYYHPSSSLYAIVSPSTKGAKYQMTVFDKLGPVMDSQHDTAQELADKLVEDGYFYKYQEIHYQLKEHNRSTVDTLYGELLKTGYKVDSKATNSIKIDDTKFINIIADARIGNVAPADFDNVILNNDSLNERQKNDIVTRMLEALKKGYDRPNSEITLKQYLARFYGYKIGIEDRTKLKDSGTTNSPEYKIRINDGKVESYLSEYGSDGEPMFSNIRKHNTLEDAMNQYSKFYMDDSDISFSDKDFMTTYLRDRVSLTKDWQDLKANYRIFRNKGIETEFTGKPYNAISYQLKEGLIDTEVFYTKAGVEVIKNPSNRQYQELYSEFKKYFPEAAKNGDAYIRTTYDTEGNKYIWNASDAVHSQVEKIINEKYNTKTNQNKYFDVDYQLKAATDTDRTEKINPLNGEVLEKVYKGFNPDSDKRIKTGNDEWDSYFFVADNSKSASAYGQQIEEYTVSPGAKILYEGTKEFKEVTKGIGSNISMLEWANTITNTAKENGYDAVWFDKQTDIGTAIINRDILNIPDNLKNYQLKVATDTDEFKQWFKDSKVVDDEGKPLVVYHGSLWNFTQFKGNMFFFSTSESFATDYADTKGFNAGIDNDKVLYEAYLSPQKLFDYNNDEDLNLLKDKLESKVAYGFGRTMLDKGEFIDRIKGRYVQPSMWAEELISSARFGKTIGDSREGYNTDRYVGINNGEVVTVGGREGDLLEMLNEQQLEQLIKTGKVDVEYLADKYEKYPSQRFALNEKDKMLEMGFQEYLIGKKSETLIAYYNSLTPTVYEGQDNWDYFELTDALDVVKSMGYDGIKLKEGGVENYAVFNPTQIKSVYNNGMFNEYDPNINYQLKETKPIVNVEGFYSNLENVINDKMGSRGKGQDILNMLAKGGIKKDEMNWFMIEDFLKDKDMVTKEELLDHMRTRAIEFTKEDMGDEFETYTLDGGDNYRFNAYTYKHSGKPYMNSTHFNSLENVIGHNRYKDFTDKEGNKVLLIEEMQSDWHQKGRATEYVDYNKVEQSIDNKLELLYKAEDAYNVIYWEWEDKNKEIRKVNNDWEQAESNYKQFAEQIKDEQVLKNLRATPDALSKEVKRLYKELIPLGQKKEVLEKNVRIAKHELGNAKDQLFSGVPDAPLKESITDFLFKQAIKDAVEGGYDAIAWTTGEQQAERWNVGQYVSRIEWNKSDGLYGVMAMDKQNKMIMSDGAMTIEQVAAYFGSEVAKTMEADESNQGFIDGQNIKASNFYNKLYDNYLPRMIKKYGKKWGLNVGDINIGNNSDFNEQLLYAARNGREMQTILTQPSIPVTPAMIEDVMTQGQPLFQLKPIDTNGDLLAIHNLTEGQLIGSLKLGGLPSPSVAVVKKDYNHSRYGEISIVLSKDVIDPKASKYNKIYGGDAYTPTFPSLSYKLDDKVSKSLATMVNNAVRNTEYDGVFNSYFDNDNLSDRINNRSGSFKEAFISDPLMMLTYLKENNIPFEPVIREKDYGGWEYGLLEKISKEFKDSIKDKYISVEDAKRIAPSLTKSINDFYGTDLFKETLAFGQIDRILDNVINYIKDDTKTEIDRWETDKKLKQEVNLQDYSKWLDEVSKGIVAKEGFRNNKDMFNPSGSRRSWDALHNEVTLDRVVKHMRDQEQTAVGGFNGIGQFIAASSKIYKTIAEVKADMDRLGTVNETEYESIRDAYGERLYEIAHEIKDPTEKNPFIASDRAMDAIIDSIQNSKTRSGMMSIFDEYYGLNVTGETIDQIMLLKDEVANMPTEYFEAKPKRGVLVNEWAGVVVPETISPETEQMLKENGVHVIEKYNGTDEDRQRAMDSFLAKEDVLFQLKETKTDTENFKKWFKDSKVVDQDGKPMKVYHGSPNQFTEFNSNIATGWGEGIYFTDNPDAATEYAYNDNGDKQNLYEVYLTINNPYRGDITYDEIENTRAYNKIALERFGEDYRELNLDAMEMFNEDGKLAGEVIRELGYDGIITEGSNSIDGKEVVVFNPTQIKSVYNTGAWEATNPDIYYQMKEGPEIQERSWGQTVRDAAITEPWLKQILTDNKFMYDVKHNEDTMIAGARLIDDKGVEYVEARLLSDLQPNTILFAASQILTHRFMEDGEQERALRLIDRTAASATTLGQTIQILSVLGRQTPEGMMRFVVGAFKKQVTERDTKKVNRLTEDLLTKFNILNKESIDNIDMVGSINKIKDMTDRDIINREIAKTDLVEKYGPDTVINNPDIMTPEDRAILDSIPPKTEVDQAMSDKIADTINRHYIDGKGNLKDKLVDVGLNEIEADILAKHIQSQVKQYNAVGKQDLINETLKQKKSVVDEDILNKLAQGDLIESDLKNFVANKMGLPTLTNELADYIYEQGKYINTLEDGREKDIAVAKMIKEIANQIPPSLGTKINTIQTMAQLLNFRTTMRNLLGNEGFRRLDTFVLNYLGTPIDALLARNSKQVTMLARFGDALKEQKKGYKEGFKIGLEDALLGINTSDQDSKYNLRRNRAFTDGILGQMETALDITMRATDRASFGASFADTIVELMTIAKVDEATEDMIDKATMLALYRTFNDSSLLAQSLSGVKKGLNKIGFSDGSFGLGDFVLKYPKTPANILSRAVDYSPAGVLVTMFKLYKDTTSDDFMRQRMKAEGFARAIAGSGLIAIGVMLARLGVITGSNPEDDEDIYKLEKAHGLRDYSVNVSAIPRLIMSGFNPKAGQLKKGDIIASYDWVEPMAMSVAMGADIILGNGDAVDKLSLLMKSLETGVTALTDQPLLSGLTTMFGQRSFAAGLGEIVKGAGSSFTPSLLAHVAQFTDGRDTDPYTFYGKGEQAFNLVKNRIPVARGTLPQRVTVFGDGKRYFPEDANKVLTFVNMMFSPAISGRYQPTQEVEYLIDLYRETGNVDIIPRPPQKSYTINKQVYKFTPENWEKMSRWLGDEYTKEYKKAIPSIKGNNTKSQIERLERIQKSVKDKAKKKVLELGYKAE